MDGGQGLCRSLSFFFSSRRRHTRYWRDWSSDVCSSDLTILPRPAKALVHSALASVFSRGVYERSRFSVLLRLPGSNPSRRFLFRVSHRPPMSADSSCIRRTLEPGKHQSGGTPKRMQSRLGLTLSKRKEASFINTHSSKDDRPQTDR